MAAPQTAARAVTIFAAGIITIGIATALFLPGRSTVKGIKAAGEAASGTLGTAIKG